MERGEQRRQGRHRSHQGRENRNALECEVERHHNLGTGGELRNGHVHPSFAHNGHCRAVPFRLLGLVETMLCLLLRLHLASLLAMRTVVQNDIRGAAYQRHSAVAHIRSRGITNATLGLGSVIAIRYRQLVFHVLHESFDVFNDLLFV